MLTPENQKMVDEYRHKGMRPPQYGPFFGTSPERESVAPITPTEPVQPKKTVPEHLFNAGKYLVDLAAGGVIGLGQDAYTNASYLRDLLHYGESDITPVSGKQALLHGAEAALDVATFGTGGIFLKGGVKLAAKIGLKKTAAKVAATAAEKTIKGRAVEIGIIGGIQGTGYGMISGLEKENPTFMDVAKSAALGGGTGAIAGAILGGVIGKIGKKGGKGINIETPENVIQQMADEGAKIPTEDLLKSTPPPSEKIIVTKGVEKKGALGFYDTATGRIGLQDLMDNQTLIHETAHGRFESLPAEGQKALTATIAELKNNPQKYGEFKFTGNAKEDVAAFAEQYLINKRKDKAFSKALADTPGGSDLVRFAKGAIDDAANKTIKAGGKGKVFAQEASEELNKKISLMSNPITEKEKSIAEAESIIFAELENATAGRRIVIDTSQDIGVGTSKVIGQPSTFPKWIPEEMRSKKIIQSVLDNIANDTLPKKAEEIRFYNLLKNKFDELRGVIKKVETGFDIKDLKLFKLEEVDVDIPAGKFSPRITKMKIYRDAQNFEYIEKMAADPTYLERLDEMGGGRVITDSEILEKALQEPAATIGWLSNLTPDSKIKTTDPLRATFLLEDIPGKIEKAWQMGDESLANMLLKDYQKAVVGFEIMAGISGRTLRQLKVNPMVEFLKVKAAQFHKIQDLLEAGKTMEQIKDILAKDNAGLERVKWYQKWMETKVGKYWRGLETYSVGAKVSSPVTLGKNIISNIGIYIQNVAEDFTAAGIKLAQRKPQEARALIANAFGNKMGVMNGLRKFRDAYIDDIILAEYMAGREGTMKSVLSGKHPYAKFANPFRFLAAGDGLFRGILYEKNRAINAGLKAAATGLKGDDLAKATVKYMDDAGVKLAAYNKSKEYVLQESPDALLSSLSSIRNTIPGGRFFVPFIATLWNSAKFAIRRGPLGLLSPTQQKKILGGGNPAVEAWSQIIVGTTMTMTAYSFIDNAKITGAYPEDADERAFWRSVGRKPYSIEIAGRWVQYNQFQPLGIYLVTAKNLYDAINSKDKDVQERAFALAAGMGNSLREMNMLSGVKTIWDWLDNPQDEKTAQKLANLFVQGFFPNALRDVRQIVDPTMREETTTTSAIANVIPWVSESLPAKYDLLGKERSYEKDLPLRVIKVLSTESISPETQFLADTGVAPIEPSPTLTKEIDGIKESFELTGKNRVDYLTEMGKATEEAIRDQMKSKSYLMELSTEERQNEIKDAIKEARSEVTDEWKDKIEDKDWKKKKNTKSDFNL